jgi:hypothetical protein
MFLFINFAPNEHSLTSASYGSPNASCRINSIAALVIHTLKSFVTNKSVPIFDRLTLPVQRATDPVSLTLPRTVTGVLIAAHGGLRGTSLS